MIKIGNYIVEDWEEYSQYFYEHNTTKTSKQRFITYNGQRIDTIKIMVSHAPPWQYYIRISSTTFIRYFNLIHGEHFHPYNNYYTIEAAKDCVDNTLNKIIKLKAFL